MKLAWEEATVPMAWDDESDGAWSEGRVEERVEEWRILSMEWGLGIGFEGLREERLFGFLCLEMGKRW